jgi:large subunit ribosomal protein L24
VLKVLDNDRVLVEGINIAKKHQKANPNAMPPVQGGIVDKEMPIAASNVLVFNPKTKKGDRVGIRVSDDGSRVRIFKSNNEVVDI